MSLQQILQVTNHSCKWSWLSFLALLFTSTTCVFHRCLQTLSQYSVQHTKSNIYCISSSTFTNVNPLSMTSWTTFVYLTSLITLFNNLYMYFWSLILLNASTYLRKIVVPFEYVMKLIILNFIDPIDIRFHVFIIHL